MGQYSIFRGKVKLEEGEINLDFCNVLVSDKIGNCEAFGLLLTGNKNKISHQKRKKAKQQTQHNVSEEEGTASSSR